jgi:hypothetical protein
VQARSRRRGFSANCRREIIKIWCEIVVVGP